MQIRFIILRHQNFVSFSELMRELINPEFLECDAL